MSIELVMPSNHLILSCPLLLLPSVFPSIRVFSNQSALRIRWPKYWSFSISKAIVLQLKNKLKKILVNFLSSSISEKRHPLPGLHLFRRSCFEGISWYKSMSTWVAVDWNPIPQSLGKEVGSECRTTLLWVASLRPAFWKWCLEAGQRTQLSCIRGLGGYCGHGLGRSQRNWGSGTHVNGLGWVVIFTEDMRKVGVSCLETSLACFKPDSHQDHLEKFLFFMFLAIYFGRISNLSRKIARIVQGAEHLLSQFTNWWYVLPHVLPYLLCQQLAHLCWKGSSRNCFRLWRPCSPSQPLTSAFGAQKPPQTTCNT